MSRYGILDSPYLGCCSLYDHHHPEGDRPFDGRCWDDPETHRRLTDDERRLLNRQEAKP